MALQQLPQGYPANVAIILDGNGRWAKKRGLPRAMGHRQGCVTLEQIIRDANDLGLSSLTVYGFSTENWKRPEEEVGALMNLFRYYMKRIIGIAVDGNVRIRMIGERSRFAPDIIEGIENMESQTAHCTGMVLVIAINYGGRDEITRAARKMAREAADGTLSPEEITESTVAAHLDTAGLPDPPGLEKAKQINEKARFSVQKSTEEELVEMERFTHSVIRTCHDKWSWKERVYYHWIRQIV